MNQSKVIKRIRVLSYNIHKGFSVGNRNFVLHDIREAIRSVSPDFVFLQEVLGEHEGHRAKVPGWPDGSQFEFMADSLWPHYAYGRNAVYDEGHHGNAILSKYPILEWENQDVSTSRLERRGLLHAVVQPEGIDCPLHLVCTHFSLFERDRRKQAHILCDRIREKVFDGSEKREPVIVAGDFNDWSLKLSRVFKKHLGLREAYYCRHHRHARTFPARFPLLRLDRIYFAEKSLKVTMARCLHRDPWPRLSDHAPLLAEFEWA